MSRPLMVGVQLPEVEYVARWPALREMAESAEWIGLDSIWVGDHLLYRDAPEPPRGPWEAWSLLAALAAVTERITLGPLVAATGFHSPAMLAKKAATVDEISGGRLVLGLGAGWNEAEYRAFGFAFDHRISRFQEAFTIIRRLLRGEEVEFQGRFYQLERCVLVPPPRPGGLPMMVGSSGERMLSIAAPHVQAWNAWFDQFGNRPEGIAPLRDRVDAACHAAGRDPAEVERTVALLVALPGAVGRRTRAAADSGLEPIRGEPAVIADRLRAFAGEGIGHVQLILDPISAESIRALEPVLAELDR